MYNVSEIIPLSTLKDWQAEKGRGRESVEVKISVCIKDDGFVSFASGKPHGERLAKTLRVSGVIKDRRSNPLTQSMQRWSLAQAER